MRAIIKKVMDWALQKEEEIAKDCHLKTNEVDEQIEKITQKREELEQKCQEELAKMSELLERLHKIREYSLKCERKGE